MKTINGIVPVMLTPFTAGDRIDYPALAKLIDWYLEKGVDALFAVCQSSEMQFLSLEERVELARFVVQHVMAVSRLSPPAISAMTLTRKNPSCWRWRRPVLMLWYW
jgi:dihydrodipicolinate synthase/N-acetylneuraminate lyase